MTPAQRAALVGFTDDRLSALRVRPARVIRGGLSITRARTEPHDFDADASATAWIAEMRGARP